MSIQNILELQEEIIVLKSKKETIPFNGFINFMEINEKLNDVKLVRLNNDFKNFEYN